MASVLYDAMAAVPEIEWNEVNPLASSFTIGQGRTLTAHILLNPLSDRLMFRTAIHYASQGTWHDVTRHNLRQAVVLTLAAFADSCAKDSTLPTYELALRMYAAKPLLFGRSKWRHDVRQMESDIIANALALPPVPVNAGQLALTKDKTGALSLT